MSYVGVYLYLIEVNYWCRQLALYIFYQDVLVLRTPHDSLNLNLELKISLLDNECWLLKVGVRGSCCL